MRDFIEGVLGAILLILFFSLLIGIEAMVSI